MKIAEGFPRGYKTQWEKEKWSLQAIPPSPLVFSNTFTVDMIKNPGLAWERVETILTAKVISLWSVMHLHVSWVSHNSMHTSSFKSH